ncbi:alkaline phosphatase D family protein [Streptomyces sp. TRM 70361]|uniref:alkaline phosphatase D family protein n=1 Tax=Streptomyces sp. TRM 70361 TaxID=3116553 RepID=UPI002E7B9147|nr:alkaline phosphatase D family protein [Streptomyces sp. TRM 70361]MEE1939809.1 alkaline phosphatase D family protein [Streptomyces sp. TRM 70361]
MAGLRLGPLLRYADTDSATVWVETDRPCEAEVRCGPEPRGGEAPRDGGGPRASCRTWQVAGHHYALVPVTGLRPGTETPYRVLLDGEQVWPPPDSPFPPPVVRTLPPPDGAGGGPDGPPLRVTFGSCRWAARPSAAGHAAIGPDALDTLARQVLAGTAERPDVLLLLGDQVYADETSEVMRRRIAARRNLAEPPWGQVADYEEYTWLYEESWLDPRVRWLLSTVPTCMIFDDHDLIDDWNTSEAWRREIRATSWWRERVLGGLTSYWVHQHLGNLSPAELAADGLYAAVRSTDGDAVGALREFAERADADPTTARWSYRRDLGRVRLLMVDTRAARVLAEDDRAMLDADEGRWLREQVFDGRGSYDHLLIGSSLPWLLPPAVHDAEAWNAALCRGTRGPRWARLGEKVRQAADLEHWAAFPESFGRLGELLAAAGRGPAAPATVLVLSGDVHHAYTAEPDFGEPVDARVAQLTCSPMHNSVPAVMRWGFRFGWSRAGRLLGRILTRHGRAGRPPVDWRRTGGPWFGNQLMTLALHGRRARLRLDRTHDGGEDGGPVLETVLDRELSGPGPASRPGEGSGGAVVPDRLAPPGRPG